MSSVWSNAGDVAAHLAAIPFAAQRETLAITTTYTSLLRTLIIRNANTGEHPPGAPHIPGTGPGPNIATSDYIRSWSTRIDITPISIRGEAFTNAPQARRLEFGFVGRDALNRSYHQPPYPHAGPALDEVQPVFVIAMETMLRRVTA